MFEGEAVFPCGVEFFGESPSLVVIVGMIFDVLGEVPHLLFGRRFEGGFFCFFWEVVWDEQFVFSLFSSFSFFLS